MYTLDNASTLTLFAFLLTLVVHVVVLGKEVGKIHYILQFDLDLVSKAIAIYTIEPDQLKRQRFINNLFLFWAICALVTLLVLSIHFDIKNNQVAPYIHVFILALFSLYGLPTIFRAAINETLTKITECRLVNLNLNEIHIEETVNGDLKWDEFINQYNKAQGKKMIYITMAGIFIISLITLHLFRTPIIFGIILGFVVNLLVVHFWLTKLLFNRKVPQWVEKTYGGFSYAKE